MCIVVKHNFIIIKSFHSWNRLEEDWSYPEMVVMACQVLVNRVLARKCLQKLLPQQDVLCTELCNVTVCHCHKLFFNFHQLPKETTITVNNYSHSSRLHRASMIIKHFIIQIIHNI